MTDADVWAEGAVDEGRGAAFLSVSVKTFRANAKREGWPRKRVPGQLAGGRGKLVYPASLVRAFLLACPAAVTTRPGRAKA